MGTVPGGQPSCCGGGGQYPSLSRGAPPGQPDGGGGVRPQVPSWYDRALQHMPFTRKFGAVQVVVVGQLPSLLRCAPPGQPDEGGGGGGGGGSGCVALAGHVVMHSPGLHEGEGNGLPSGPITGSPQLHSPGWQ